MIKSTMKISTGKLLSVMIVLWTFLMPAIAFGQVTVNSSSGSSTTGNYTTLGSAFTAINNGTHKGVITIDITGNTSEGSNAALLKASGQDSANYTSVVIRPTVTATISGAPGSGRGLIELDGADNVTINGDIAGGTVGRDLTIENTTASGTSNTAVVRLMGRTTLGLGADNVQIMNSILIGNDNTTSSTHVIISAGGGTLTSLGYDNDNLHIDNNEIMKAYRGIYFNISTGSTTLSDSVVITNNLIGSNDTAKFITNTGMFIENAVKPLIAFNEVFNIYDASSGTISGIVIEGSNTVADSAMVLNNIIRNMRSDWSTGWGTYGISLAGGKNTLVANNVIYDINSLNYSSGTTYSAFGIRISTGTGHRIYYNSVNMNGHQSVGSTDPTSAALLVSSTSVTGLTVKNNIFANTHTSTTSSPSFVAIHFPSSYNFADVNLDHNGYFVPNAANYYVGRVGSVNYTDLTAWQAVSQVGNTSNDVNSVPNANHAAPFTSATNLTIPAGTATPLESGGVFIAELGTPNYDFTGLARPAGTGTAPDIGAFEFAGVLADFDAPVFTSVTHSPATSQCTPTSRTVTAVITDSSGVASAEIVWSVNGVSQTNIPMTFSAGSWTGVIPASGSDVVTYQVAATDSSFSANTGFSSVQSYSDVPLVAVAGSDVTICAGDSTLLIGGTNNYPIKISEITQYRSGTGATNPYPSAYTGGDLVEFSNSTSQSLSIENWTFTVTGTGARNYTFPAGTVVPANGILVLHIGSGTDNPSANYYNTGGSSESISSSSSTGYILRNFKGVIMDAVATNSHSFPASENVTSSDWSGNIGSSSGDAGVTRNGADNNLASDWTISSSTNVQTMGTYNSGMPSLTSSVSFAWSTGDTTTSVMVSPTTTTSYIFTVSDGTCSNSDTVDVIVIPLPGAPVTVNDTICGPDSVTVQATGTGTLSWFSSMTSTTPLATGSSYSFYATGQDTVYVEDQVAQCPGPRSMAIIHYITPPAMTVTVDDDSVCIGTGVLLAVTSANAYTYSWTGSGLSANTGANVSATPAGTGYYTVYATDGTCNNVDSVVVNVFNFPVVNVTAVPNPACIGDTVTLSANSIPAVLGTGTSYNSDTGYPDVFGNYYDGAKHQVLILASELQALGWSAGPISSLSFEVLGGTSSDSLVGFGISMGHTNLTTMSAWETGLTSVYTSSYYQPVMGANEFTFSTPFNWDGTSNIVIETCFNNVNYDYNFGTAYTSTSFTSVRYYRADGNSTLCSSTNTTGTSSNRPNMVLKMNVVNNYQWSPAANLSSATAQNPTFVATQTQTYTVVVTDPVSGCTYTDSVNVMVNPNPVVSLGVDTGYCAGGSYLVDAGNTGNTFNWNTGATTQTLSVNAPGVYSVVVTDMNNCTATDTIDITEYSLPVVNLGNDTIHCAGTTIGLDAGAGFVSYNWNTGATTQTIAAQTAGTYDVTVSDTNGCVNNDIIVLTAGTIPTVNLGLDTAVCPGNTVNLDAGAGFVTYNWNTGDSVQTVTATNPGLYIVSVSNTDGCFNSDSIEVENFDDVRLVLGPDIETCNNSQVLLNAGGGYSSYLWNTGDTTATLSVSTWGTTSGSVDYIVTVTTADGCTGTDTITVIINDCTGLTENSDESSVTVMPNPGMGIFYITTGNESGVRSQYLVTDISGRKVSEGTFTGNQGAFDISSFSPGVYNVLITSDNKHSVVRIIKQ